MKWRVERCGSASSGYIPGWIAMNPEATRGAVFPTHAAAIAFADRHARIEFERDSKNALMKLASRGVPAAGLPSRSERAPKLEAPKRRRPYRRITEGEVRAAQRMRDDGRTWAEIATTLGVKTPSIYKAVQRKEAA